MITYSNGNSFSDGQSMSLDKGTEREAPLTRWLLEAIRSRP